jgi:hypothetical protein
MKLPAFLSRLAAAFSCPRRLCLYAGVFLGALGGDILIMMFSYKIAAGSAADLLTYWMLYFSLSGLFLLPALCGFYCRAPLALTRALLLALTAAGFACYWLGREERTILLSLASILINVPFWTCYHLTFLAYSSDANRGHEISVAYVVMGVGAISGYFLCGLLAAALTPAASVAIGFSAIAAGTLTLIALLPPPLAGYRFFPALLTRLREANTGWLATFGMGGHNSLAAYLLPTFLGKSGFTALATGITLGLRAGATAFAAPFTGHLILGGRQAEMRVGIVLFVLAWLALLLPVFFPVRLALAIVLWAAAGQFYSSGMDMGWYGMKAPDAVAAREILLNAGRLALMAIGAPWLFASPQSYPWLALAYAAGFGALLWTATLRRKAVA